MFEDIFEDKDLEVQFRNHIKNNFKIAISTLSGTEHKDDIVPALEYFESNYMTTLLKIYCENLEEDELRYIIKMNNDKIVQKLLLMQLEKVNPLIIECMTSFFKRKEAKELAEKEAKQEKILDEAIKSAKKRLGEQLEKSYNDTWEV